ncbi:hypothetical protein [Streptomyces lavendulae]|uniref:hypothetical protein n=1 Tax=Streptomyces lavendulae TaxID=1914 RepID=UPI0036EEEFA1
MRRCVRPVTGASGTSATVVTAVGLAPYRGSADTALYASLALDATAVRPALARVIARLSPSGTVEVRVAAGTGGLTAGVPQALLEPSVTSRLPKPRPPSSTGWDSPMVQRVTAIPRDPVAGCGSYVMARAVPAGA